MGVGGEPRGTQVQLAGAGDAQGAAAVYDAWDHVMQLLDEMEKLLGIPVIPISASKNEGTAELVDHALHVARFQEPPVRQDFCAPDEHDGAVHRCLHSIMALIEDHAERAGIPPRFAASKLAEGDQLVLDRLDLDQNEKDALEHIICQMEAERGLDRAAAIADMRFSFIGRVCEQTVVKPTESREHARSTRIDKLLTGPFTAIPAFVAIMALVFWLIVAILRSINRRRAKKRAMRARRPGARQGREDRRG